MPDVPADHRIYSCDDHLDIYHLPRDLWMKRLPAKYREAGPKVVEREGAQWWVAGDALIGRSGKYPGVATERGDVEDDGFRPSDPKLRMEDMERDGIHASLVYGPGALFGWPVEDPTLTTLVLRAWNDWAAEEFNSYLPDRLSALAALPTDSPKRAVDELRRCIDLGHKGVVFRAHDLEDLTELGGEWEPLWSALEETGIPLSLHIGGGGSLKLDPRAGYETSRWRIAAIAAALPLQLDEPFAVMMYSGVLERHPGLKLVLAESGIGWLPYYVKRMDATFEKHCAPDPTGIRTRPSELFARQVWATFEEEPLGPQLIPLLGPDNFMWACDYPHPDSTWPRSREAIAEAMGSLDAETIRKVTGENCRKLYGLP